MWESDTQEGCDAKPAGKNKQTTGVEEYVKYFVRGFVVQLNKCVRMKRIDLVFKGINIYLNPSFPSKARMY